MTPSDDLETTATSASSSEPNTLTPRWTFRGAFGSLGSPLVAAGDRLIGVGNGIVYALDTTPFHGEAIQPVWQYNLAAFDGGDPQVTAAGGIVYLMDGDALLAFRLSDKTPVPGWGNVTLRNVNSMFVAGRRLVVLHGGPRGSTMASGYDAITASHAFGPVKVSDRTVSHAAYGSNAVVFVDGGGLKAVNVGFGDLRWTFTGHGDTLDAGTAPLVAGDVVLVPGGKLHAVDLITGVERWTVATKSGAPAHWRTPVADVPVPVVAATINANAAVATPASAGNTTTVTVAPSAAGVAVATNSAGELVAVSLFDGSLRWRQPVVTPSAPRIVARVVYVTTDHGSRVSRFDLDTGHAIGVPYLLPNHTTQSSSVVPDAAVVNNGSLVIAEDDGTIVSRPFASQAAALFDGKASRIDITPDGNQFDFGVADFTVEMWFRSSSGGELISSYPTSDDAGAHGFRLNLTPDGDLRFAVTGLRSHSATIGLAASTGAADGEWHHVALVRKKGRFLVVLDGLSMPIRLPDDHASTPLSIGGKSGLTIGAAVGSQGGDAEAFFRGLMREVRIWNCALEASAIATNLNRELKGTEPGLKGLWRLNEVHDPATPDSPVPSDVDITNVVLRHHARANFVNPASYPTDLTMDESLFPYLLPESAPQWPYASTWAVRGMLPVTGAVAVSANGYAAFGTNNVIYAVDAHTGARAWSMDVSESASPPIADNSGFFVLTEEESLLYLDARTGKKTQIDAFAGMLHDKGAVLAPPAVTPVYLAAATGGGSVLVNVRGQSTAGEAQVNGRPTSLSFGAPGLVVLSHVGTGRELTVIDIKPDKPVAVGRATVTGDAFCIVGSWVIGVKDGAVVKLHAGNMGAALATSEQIPGTITGLLASIDDDVLIATTDSGDVYGFTLGRLVRRWKERIPVGADGPANSVNEPAFDQSGRLLCTTSSGTIAVLDPESGALLGRYGANRGCVGRPSFAAGTLYTGCKDSIDPAADYDGALHSVVFGETMVLRLNLDELGVPATSGQHAIIDAETAAATLHLLGVHESCVEAWVNVPRFADADLAQRVGGGILGICPTTASGFDVNLWLDPDGTLHYTSRAEDGTAWSGMHVTARTHIVDGAWHHIAVSRSKPTAPAAPNAPDRVIVYVDGVKVTTANAQPPAAPTTTLTGLKAYVGAAAADDLSASRPFCGMIGEVRVWDTYLEPTELAARMHVKLRGDEPDLLAYWNFARESIHDSAFQGHDGVLASPSTVPVWWLTDLPFHEPSYPHILSSAKIRSQDDTQTSYEATVKVCAADGTGLGKQEVHLWYVRHSPDDPASILVNSHELVALSSDAEPQPTDPGKPVEAHKVFVGTTAPDGTLTLNVVTSLHGHGPALDMWTQFMKGSNERFHLNLLIDNQKLAKPAPPSLIAQSKLLQDYHYAHGDEIDHTKDRSTWRVVIRAANPDNSPRPREAITITAEKQTIIEVRGEAHTVNTDNAVTLHAENDGELTIVMSADKLTAPALFATAAFMHRNDKIVIHCDQETHRTLSKYQSSHLTENRVVNWQKDPNAPARGTPPDPSYVPNNGTPAPLVRPEFHGKAPEVAKAIRQVSAAAKPHDPHADVAPTPATPARAALHVMRGGLAGDVALGTPKPLATPAIPAMRQPLRVAPSDHVVLQRSVAGAARHAPLNPDAFHRALDGNLGFVFEVHPTTGLNYELLATHEQVTAARGHPTPHHNLLGGPFDFVADKWNDLKHGLEAGGSFVVNGIKRIVVSFRETLQLAITFIKDGVMKIVHTVATTVQDALNVIASFFEQLLVDIMMVIAFLRGMFDWTAILKTHDILHDAFTATIDTSLAALRNPGTLTDTLASLAGLSTPPVPAGLPSPNAIRNEVGRDSVVLSHANSVQGKGLTARATTTPSTIAYKDRGTPPAPGTITHSSSNEDAMRGILGIAPGLLDLSPSDLLERLQSVGFESASTLVHKLATFMPTLADPVKWAADALDATINLGFISKIYKWITGNSLTILDLFCLCIAVPVNLAYSAVTLIIDGSPANFWDDASGFDAQLRSGATRAQNNAKLAPRLRSAPRNMLLDGAAEGDAPTPVVTTATGIPGTPRAAEISYMIFRFVTHAMDCVADFEFAERAKLGPAATDAADMKTVKHWQGMAGMIYLSVQAFCCDVHYYDRVRAVAGADADRFLPIEWLGYVKYSLQMALRANKMRATIQPELGLGEATGTASGKLEFGIAMLCFGLATTALVFEIKNMAQLRSRIASYGNNNVKDQFTLFGARDIIGTTTVLYEWMYNPVGVAAVTRIAPTRVGGVYYVVGGIRSVSGTASIVLHGVAVFKHGS